MKQLIPAILETTFENFSKQLKKMEQISDLVQIDIVDGIFCPKKTFNDVEKINALNAKCLFELHFMTNHPLSEMQKWSSLKNIHRVIFHVEAEDNPLDCLNFARARNWQTGIALNPETPLDQVSAYYDSVDVIMFLTVNPGEQGGKFLPKVKEKIKQFTVLEKRPICEADGGINKSNIRELSDLGVEILSVGSALTKEEHPEKTYQELKSLLI